MAMGHEEPPDHKSDASDDRLSQLNSKIEHLMALTRKPPSRSPPAEAVHHLAAEEELNDLDQDFHDLIQRLRTALAGMVGNLASLDANVSKHR